MSALIDSALIIDTLFHSQYTSVPFLKSKLASVFDHDALNSLDPCLWESRPSTTQPQPCPKQSHVRWHGSGNASVRWAVRRGEIC